MTSFFKHQVYIFLHAILLCTGCATYKISTQSFLEKGGDRWEQCDFENEGGGGEGICFQEEKDEDLVYKNKKEALNHWLYCMIPRHRSQIRWYDLGHWCMWTLFGNDDDGIFGEEPTALYHIDQVSDVEKALCWTMRNPLHNCCFYVVGSAYTKNSEVTLLKICPNEISMGEYSSEGKIVFASEKTSFFLGLHGYKPFVSLRIAYNNRYRSDFYAGWRCRGNFGLKCNLLTKRKA